MGMVKKKKHNSFVAFIIKHRLAISISAGVLVILYIIGLINPITGPALRYPYYEVYCGGKPVIATSFMSKHYVTSDMPGYDTPGLYDEMFCTEIEAMSHGYGRGL